MSGEAEALALERERLLADGVSLLRQGQAIIATLQAERDVLLDALKWLARGEHEWSPHPLAVEFMERVISGVESGK